ETDGKNRMPRIEGQKKTARKSAPAAILQQCEAHENRRAPGCPTRPAEQRYAKLQSGRSHHSPLQRGEFLEGKEFGVRQGVLLPCFAFLATRAFSPLQKHLD